MSTPKKVSESHAAEGVSFDLTTPGAAPLAALSPAPTTVQDAIETLYVDNATETVAGKAEIATNAEALTGADDARIMTPAKVLHKLNNWTPWVYDSDFTQIPKTIYGGTIPVGNYATTYIPATFDPGSILPKGSRVVFEEWYQYAVGYGNGTYMANGWRRRSMSKTESNGWKMDTE